MNKVTKIAMKCLSNCVLLRIEDGDLWCLQFSKPSRYFEKSRSKRKEWVLPKREKRMKMVCYIFPKMGDISDDFLKLKY